MILQKLTKQSLKNFKNESDNTLTKYVCGYVLNHTNGKSIKQTIENILNCGCESGIVKELVYYCDALKFYKKFQHEIVYLLNNLMWDCEYKSPAELFGDKWDAEDPLALDEDNQKLLAWFGFEETLRNIANEFGIE